MQRREYDGSQDYVITWDQEKHTAYMEFNPKCQYCHISLKRKEFESIQKDHVRSSPTYKSIIAKHYMCPDCKVPTEYRTTDLARALATLKPKIGTGTDKSTFNIVLDPFMSNT